MKKLIIVLGGVVAVIAIGFISLRIYTKSFSPEGLASYEKKDLKIGVTYGRPYKKGRVIFGELVPYGQVWRTGANEATVFTTNKDLLIGSQLLKSGTYSLFTIPNPDNWQIIFNSTVPSWGVDFSAQAARDEETDALLVEVPSIKTNNMFEQFTIDFEEMKNELDMVMMWDETLVVVPMQPAQN